MERDGFGDDLSLDSRRWRAYSSKLKARTEDWAMPLFINGAVVFARWPSVTDMNRLRDESELHRANRGRLPRFAAERSRRGA
jgi:hypothetical protein